MGTDTKEKTKICTVCKTPKPLSAFGKNRSRQDGLQNYCRECGAKKDRAYREKKKKNRAQAEPPLLPVPGQLFRPVIQLDFADYPSFFAQLKEKAKAEFRTPAQQAMYMLNKILLKEKSDEVETDR